MASSETEICNSALIKIGADRITSLDDDSREAIFCKEQYSKLRDELLMSHPWNFAIERVELAQESTAPAFDWDAQYPLPSDCLRVCRLNDDQHGSSFAVEGRKLLTNTSTAKIVYIKKETDVSKYSPTFAEALAFRLATDLAYAISQNQGVANRMNQQYQIWLRDARSFNGQEGTPLDIVRDVWIESRL